MKKIELYDNHIKTCTQLMESYKELNSDKPGELLEFTGVEGRDVYNITAPFYDNNEFVIAGRVEKRENQDSEVMFFVKREGIWTPRNKTVKFRLQDPFVTRINGELIFGGVETYYNHKGENKLSYRTIFYRGADISSLKIFKKGPDGMKDIRLIEIEKEKIGIFTRPQGGICGRGTIGYAEIKNLDELSVEVINNAYLLNGQFIDAEWGGANEVHVLKNGLLGILSHIASYDELGNRHYYSTVFSFDYKIKKYSKMKIIATRSEFPKGESKRPDLEDIVFSGGIKRMKNNKAILYVGVSDAQAYEITIGDPFFEYEELI